MAMELQRERLAKLQADKIERDLRSSLFKKPFFWTSLASVAVSIAGGVFVFDSHFSARAKENQELREKLVAEKEERLRKREEAVSENLADGQRLAEKVTQLEIELELAKRDKSEVDLQAQQEIERQQEQIKELNLKLVKAAEDAVSLSDFVRSSEVVLNTGAESDFHGTRIRLINVGNFNRDADFSYSRIGEQPVYRVTSLDKGNSIARNLGGRLFIVEVVSTAREPSEQATFRLYDVLLPDQPSS